MQMNEDRLKQRIIEIARSVKNVRDSDLFTLLDNHLQPYCLANRLPWDHRNRGGSHHVFTVGACTFNIVKPHGTSLLKPAYVRAFLEAMEAIDLYTQG
jgi:hypothetical protein